MHCFDGHRVSGIDPLSEVSNGGEADANSLIPETRSKMMELTNTLKSVEASRARLGSHYAKAKAEVNETFSYFTRALEERKTEVLRELEGIFSAKQHAISQYTERTAETVDRMYQVSVEFLTAAAFPVWRSGGIFRVCFAE